jgi:GNAT superfamily N-acetyltransferase
MKIIRADGALLERIFDTTYSIWHEGLSRHAYGQWNVAQMRLPWAANHVARFALVDDHGAPLASLKRYRYDVRLDGRVGMMCGLGAIFTMPEHRGRGHASRLIEDVLAQEQRDGVLMAGLFSEIGTAFYERLGFRAIALDEVTVNVVSKGGSPAMLVRAGDDRDLPALATIHETRTETSRFALRRDAAAMQFAIAKKRLFAGLSEPFTRRLEFFVTEEGNSAVAYVVLSQNVHGWTLEEAGDRDPAGARVGAMLQVLVAREPSHTPPLIRAWWPRALAVPPQLRLTNRSDPKDIFMVRALADVALPETADDVFYWHADHF